MSRTGEADFQADAVIVNGTSCNESIRVAGEAFGASVLGLAFGDEAPPSRKPRRCRG
jgi:hypothetical protein